MQILGQQEGELGGHEARILEQQRERRRITAQRRGAEVEIHDGARVLRGRPLEALPRGCAVDELGGRRIRVQSEVEAGEEGGRVGGRLLLT